jgi:hypothetical protein
MAIRSIVDARTNNSMTNGAAKASTTRQAIDLWCDTLDGGSDAIDLIRNLIRASIDADLTAEAARKRRDEITARAERAERRKQAFRAAAFALMAIAGVARLRRRPTATPDDRRHRGVQHHHTAAPLSAPTKQGTTTFQTGAEWLSAWAKLVRGCKAAKALDKLQTARETNRAHIDAVAATDPETAATLNAQLDRALSGGPQGG